MSTTSLDTRALDSYERDGFAIFPGILDTDLVAEARDHVDWLLHRFPNFRPEHLHHPLMRDDAFWVRLVTDERLLDLAESFLGPDIACFTAHYICKPPGDGQAVLWHQDGAYWNLRPMEALTVWLALDDCDPANGCLRMIPGTHQLDLADIVLRDDVPNMLCSSIDARYVRDEAAVDVILRPGDVSVHHPAIIHGSEGNESGRWRRGLDIGYIRTTTQLGDTGLYVDPIVARGRPVPGVNRYRPWPAYDPKTSMDFRGRETWDARCQAVNSQVGVARPTGDTDVAEMTARMMDRLQAGTTKAGRP
ncbi:protein involved in biosynthesis of mitomycin antibiotics/polyketide fumonisin [Frankia torreyi]|uniref:Protein involved in biosynthesis of mitomycin antibiotics/polyketide fumonisin n=1 Tax=Frankia torreyi TaxID=1856 RepID=A0A0D8B9Y6_9ACTN|nr:phytanoyl-CoA dioxygenase family protein [Frankia torreyi]KJE21093.1 protein involved in biosynthesis of mitomycin antibiotics/polyketide fumonisin [Frankia torreyi]